MKAPFPFLAALAAAALCCAAPRVGPARAAATGEQDTSNGVAPIKPGEPDTAAVKGQPHVAAAPAVPSPPAPAAAPTEAQRYCENIAAVAAEARFAWQTRKLTELQAQVSEKVAELEKRQAELQASLARRDETMKRAETTLLAIYSKMQPDAAAAQLSVLDDETASAVLAQLNPRQSSAILNEIAPERASRLINALTSLPADDKSEGKKS